MSGSGRFEFQFDRRRLLEDGVPVALGSRAYDLLVALWERRSRVVEKAELLDLVWPELVVEENNLQVQIGQLRKVLGADAIATISGRGYRLTGELLAASAPTSSAAAVTAESPDDPAPQLLTPMRGRDADLASLTALIERHRLVTLVGAGGMGKTLLARHVVAARPNDVCWVDLGDCAEPGRVAAAVAAALGIDPGPGDPLRALCDAASSGRRRVVIDNAEHLLAEVAAVAEALLRAAACMHLLVTSQAPLLLADEQICRIGPLATPEAAVTAAQALGFAAVALFVERAHAVDPRFELTEPLTGAVVALCRQLDGVPLAIELAAARAPMLGVARLNDLLHDRLFRLLNSSRNRSAPPRQQTLLAALDWSHGLLAEREQAVLRRLAVFARSASLGDILQVVSDPGGPLDRWAAMDALGILVDRSLVDVVTPADGGLPRYRLCHATRTYALERLAQAGETDTIRRRHALGIAMANGFLPSQQAGRRSDILPLGRLADMPM